MPESKKLNATKNKEHCRGGLGGTCNDKEVPESVIKDIGTPGTKPKK